MFIDETWASTNMARKRGRCRRGRRLRAAIPHGHYKTITLVAGLRLSGLVAQKAFDRPINAASFEEWVEKCLVPALSKGDIVVMDNLSSHKGPRVEQLIKAAGAELRYLPPYSPDMNPIEKAYSKLKAILRKIAERTVAGLLIALDACADIFKPAECANYFWACGYVARIFVIEAGWAAWLHCDGDAGFGDELLAGLVQSNHWPVRIARPRVNRQHVLHRRYECAAGLGRNDPILAAVRLKRVFLSVRWIFESLAAWTMPNSTTLLSSSRKLQRAYPSGGLEQAKAIRRASFSPSKIRRTAGAAGALRLKTASNPSSTNCRRTR